MPLPFTISPANRPAAGDSQAVFRQKMQAALAEIRLQLGADPASPGSSRIVNHRILSPAARWQGSQIAAAVLLTGNLADPGTGRGIYEALFGDGAFNMSKVRPASVGQRALDFGSVRALRTHRRLGILRGWAQLPILTGQNTGSVTIDWTADADDNSPGTGDWTSLSPIRVRVSPTVDNGIFWVGASSFIDIYIEEDSVDDTGFTVQGRIATDGPPWAYGGTAPSDTNYDFEWYALVGLGN